MNSNEIIKKQDELINYLEGLINYAENYSCISKIRDYKFEISLLKKSKVDNEGEIDDGEYFDKHNDDMITDY